MRAGTVGWGIGVLRKASVARGRFGQGLNVAVQVAVTACAKALGQEPAGRRGLGEAGSPTGHVGPGTARMQTCILRGQKRLWERQSKLQGGPGTPPTSQGWCRGSCWEPVRWPWPCPVPLWLGTWLSEWPTHRTAKEGSRATWNSKHWKRPTPTVSRHAPLPLSVLGPRVHSGDGWEDRA